MQHCRAKRNKKIGPRATAGCAKLCVFDNSLATHGRLAVPFKYCHACLWRNGPQNFSSRATGCPSLVKSVKNKKN